MSLIAACIPGHSDARNRSPLTASGTKNNLDIATRPSHSCWLWRPVIGWRMHDAPGTLSLATCPPDGVRTSSHRLAATSLDRLAAMYAVAHASVEAVNVVRAHGHGHSESRTIISIYSDLSIYLSTYIRTNKHTYMFDIPSLSLPRKEDMNSGSHCPHDILCGSSICTTNTTRRNECRSTLNID